MERSLARVSALGAELRKISGWNQHPPFVRRWERAFVAFREHRLALAAAERRHSFWYRAYLRVRRKR